MAVLLVPDGSRNGRRRIIQTLTARRNASCCPTNASKPLPSPLSRSICTICTEYHQHSGDETRMQVRLRPSTSGLPRNVTSGNTARKAIEDRNERRRSNGPAATVTGPASYNTEKEARPYIRRIMWRDKVPVGPLQIARHARYRWPSHPLGLSSLWPERGTERDDDAPPAQQVSRMFSLPAGSFGSLYPCGRRQSPYLTHPRISIKARGGDGVVKKGRGRGILTWGRAAAGWLLLLG
ncbi:hypothetical protein MGYG_05422 [Nannizzia gypsea CBS 118893]|uniref:Uncharacterized protein n=1 Tax=Arthroderma gypseum (strain ATCC MYA-4604 / CBS 118893) TaxID=535722 RepID=E4UVV0_ARTGP|nr:hypothetical protein MGYG_05422 [Nannizzia gypsea CBS 118893]EFR02427.1 hypothetical protein MGYG_05422 [Nannizzia gypsea CBS 118893]